MKPDAAPPLPRIIAFLKQGRTPPAKVIAKLAPDAIPPLLAVLPRLGPMTTRTLNRALQEIGPAAEPVLPALFDAFRTGQPRVRVGAFHCLAGLAPANAEAMECVRGALSDKSAAVRELALRVLSNARQLRDSVGQLTELVRRGDRYTFANAIKALERLGPLDPSLFPDLIKHLTKQWSDNWEVGDAAKDALVRAGLPAVRPLLEAARGTGENDLSDAIHDTIGEMGADNEALFPILREVAETSPSRAARALAVRVYEWLESPDYTVGSLVWMPDALRSSDWSFRDSAYRAVEKLGVAAAPVLPLLLERASNTRLEWSDREDAIRAIGHMGAAAEPALPALFGFVGHSSVASAAVAALTDLGYGPGAVVVLLSRSQKTGTGGHVIDNALYIDPKRSDDTADVRDVIRKTYTKLSASATLLEPAKLAVKPKPDLASIGRYLNDPSPATRLVAVFALRHLGAVAHVISALQIPDQVVRTNAVRALARLGRGDPNALKAVRAATKDRAAGVRAAATKALRVLNRKG